jgi:hypothetical protein
MKRKIISALASLLISISSQASLDQKIPKDNLESLSEPYPYQTDNYSKLPLTQNPNSRIIYFQPSERKVTLVDCPDVGWSLYIQNTEEDIEMGIMVPENVEQELIQEHLDQGQDLVKQNYPNQGWTTYVYDTNNDQEPDKVSLQPPHEVLYELIFNYQKMMQEIEQSNSE